MPELNEVLRKYENIDSNDIKNNAQKHLKSLKDDVTNLEPLTHFNPDCISSNWTLKLQAIEKEGIDNYKFSNDEKNLLILINKINKLRVNLITIENKIREIVKYSKMKIPSDNELENKVFKVISSLDTLQRYSRVIEKLKETANAYVASLEGSKQEESKTAQVPTTKAADRKEQKPSVQKQETLGKVEQKPDVQKQETSSKAEQKPNVQKQETSSIEKELEDKIAASQAELTKKMEEILRQQKEINDLRLELNNIKTEKARVDTEVFTLGQRVGKLEEANTHMKDKTVKSQEQVDELKKDIAKQHNVIADQHELIAIQNKLIADQTKRIADQDEVIAKQNKLIADQTKGIADLSNINTTQSVATSNLALFPTPSEDKNEDKNKDNAEIKMGIVSLVQTFVAVVEAVVEDIDKNILLVPDTTKQKLNKVKAMLGEFEQHVHDKPINFEKQQEVLKNLEGFYEAFLRLTSTLNLPNDLKTKVNQLSQYFASSDLQRSPNQGV